MGLHGWAALGCQVLWVDPDHLGLAPPGAAWQVTGRAGACQVDGARKALTVNLGGSATTTACFVLSGPTG